MSKSCRLRPAFSRPASSAGSVWSCHDRAVWKGCVKKLPKDEEILQLPGRGTLDFTPLIAALTKIDYRGYSEVFMHPVPRGIPIHPSTAEVTREIQRARSYLERCVAE